MNRYTGTMQLLGSNPIEYWEREVKGIVFSGLELKQGCAE